MTTFFLFRIKIERSSSLFADLADPTLSHGEIILAAIEKKGSHSLRNGQQWRIGNLERLNDTSVFFALGRIAQKTRDLYDDEAGNFVEVPSDEAPHTYVVVDLELQVCAIARKTIVSRTTMAAAKNLQSILNATHKRDPETSHLTFALSPIEDPESFIDLIKSAFRVSEFTVQFSLPNPTDTEEQFMKPMQRYLQDARGNRGQTTIRGEELDTDLIEQMARSAASSGNGARARIQSAPDSQPAMRRSVGSQANVAKEEIATDDDKRQLAKLIRAAYRRIRNPGS